MGSPADPLSMMGAMMTAFQQGVQGFGQDQDWSSSQWQGQDRSSRGRDKGEGKPEGPRGKKKFMCQHFQSEGVCKFGRRCNFAHGPEELMEAPKHNRSKFAYCREFPKGTCKHGDWCHFAHSEAELSEDVVQLEAFVQDNNLDQTVHNKLFDLPRWILKMVFDKGSLKMNSNPSAACMMRIKEALLESELRPQDHLKIEDRQSLKGANKGAMTAAMKGQGKDKEKGAGKSKAMGMGKGTESNLAIVDTSTTAIPGFDTLDPQAWYDAYAAAAAAGGAQGSDDGALGVDAQASAWYAAFQASVAQAEEPVHMAKKMKLPGDWTCPSCGDHQFSRNYTCRNCGVMKPRPGD